MITGTAAHRFDISRGRALTAFGAASLLSPNPGRVQYLNQRLTHASLVRTTLRPRCSVVFTPNWWHARNHLWHGNHWHYCHSHRPYYWWRWATWSGVRAWVSYGWEDPLNYGYNDNVVFSDEAVYINEEPIAAADDYLQMGEKLANIPGPGDDEEIDWMPLGVFAMSASQEDKEPQMMVQLVLSKDGRLGGTYYHFRTQNMHSIKGSVDEKTQRVAFKIGDQTENLLEVGLAGLTEGEAPMWVHFGKSESTQTWMLIRMEGPPEAAEDTGADPAEDAASE